MYTFGLTLIFTHTYDAQLAIDAILICSCKIPKGFSRSQRSYSKIGDEI